MANIFQNLFGGKPTPTPDSGMNAPFPTSKEDENRFNGR
jgi:hypothetical protein